MILFVTFIFVPIAGDSTQSMLARVVSSASPLVDVIWVFLLARNAHRVCTLPVGWLVAGAFTSLGADIAMPWKNVMW